MPRAISDRFVYQRALGAQALITLGYATGFPTVAHTVERNISNAKLDCPATHLSAAQHEPQPKNVRQLARCAR